MDIKTLAQQYIREYKRTPEFANWDAVIEIGKQLADAVLGDTETYPEVKPVVASTKYTGKLNRNEKELIAAGERPLFIRAVKSVRERIPGISLTQAKALCDEYLISLDVQY